MLLQLEAMNFLYTQNLIGNITLSKVITCIYVASVN